MTFDIENSEEHFLKKKPDTFFNLKKNLLNDDSRH